MSKSDQNEAEIYEAGIAAGRRRERSATKVKLKRLRGNFESLVSVDPCYQKVVCFIDWYLLEYKRRKGKR